MKYQLKVEVHNFDLLMKSLKFSRENTEALNRGLLELIQSKADTEIYQRADTLILVGDENPKNVYWAHTKDGVKVGPNGGFHYHEHSNSWGCHT